MRLLIFLLFPASMLVGIAGAEAHFDARDIAFREHVAAVFAADCQRTRAPNAVQLRVLQRLCNCSVARIRSSDIAFADGQDGVTAKVHTATEACSTEFYGPDRGAARNRH